MDNLSGPVSWTWQTIRRGKLFMRDHLLNMAFAASRAMKQQECDPQGNCPVPIPSSSCLAFSVWQLKQPWHTPSVTTAIPGILLTHPWGDENAFVCSKHEQLCQALCGLFLARHHRRPPVLGQLHNLTSSGASPLSLLLFLRTTLVVSSSQPASDTLC